MNNIYVIGLGPGSPGALTLDAVNKIKGEGPHFLRTEKHPAVDYFRDNSVSYQTFDVYYNEGSSFEEVYKSIADRLESEAKVYGTINYYVPGNPMVAEKTVKLLLDKKDTLNLKFVSGMSFIEPMLEATGIDPVDGLMILDGVSMKSTDISIRSNLIVTQVYNQRVMSEVKLTLSELYGDDYLVYLIHGAGTIDQKVEMIPISEIDRSADIDVLSSLLVPAMTGEGRTRYSFADVLDIMEKLRGEGGCPWDREQDHLSIRQAILEEAYELVEALEDEDPEHIVEELGDLLLQVVFHMQIGYEEGEFYPFDVTSSLASKLISRHPHVFFEKKVDNSKEVVYNWNKIKYKNRNISTLSGKLKNIPRLPALMRSFKTQEKAAEIGFDWDNVEGPSGKVLEELQEVMQSYSDNGLGHNHTEEEIGDLLFAVVNLSRFLEVNPEVALNRTIGKFTKRLAKMEYMAELMGIGMEDMSLEELDGLWDQAKSEE
jgi:tetrapyrrole methylase family protein/MazG family protein